MEELSDWGLESEEEMQPAVNGELPPELQGLDLTPDDLQKIQGSDEVLKKRVIIVYDEAQEQAVAKLLGRDAIDKVIYNFDEL